MMLDGTQRCAADEGQKMEPVVTRYYGNKDAGRRSGVKKRVLRIGERRERYKSAVVFRMRRSTTDANVMHFNEGERSF